MFGAERMVLISDSLRAAGMPDGIYPFGGLEIEVHGNRATIAGHPETLAGSVTSLMGCMRKAVEFGIPLADAVRAASYNPAQAIKIDDRAGSLDLGKEASIVLLNKEDLFVDGKEGIRNVELMNAIELSGFNNGKEVYLPVDEDEYLFELNKRIKTSRLKEVIEDKVMDVSNSFGVK
jgi:adenine deaminase